MGKKFFLLFIISSLLVISAHAQGYVDVSVSEAKIMIDSNPYLVILDVRNQSEYDEGHIRNAKLIPYTELGSRLNELEKTSEILVYCRTGVRSSIASQILANNGFTHVYNILEGITAWIDQEYPVYTKHPSIQEAINNANAADTLYISSGVYHENILVNKSISLIGENKKSTIINGTGETTVSLEANNTKIEEFTVQNGHFGVRMAPWTNGHTISSNIILNNYYGVGGHYNCYNITICDNIITSNTIAGIQMLFSHSTVANNLISDNGKDQYAPFGSGIQIVMGINSKIIYCVNNAILGNTIKNHQTGILAVHYSEENFIIHNNFVNNTKQFSLLAATWNNTLEENNWSDYNGTDTNRDGVGDTPYKIDDHVQDANPLMGMFSSYRTSLGYTVEVVANSTIEYFEYFTSNSTIKMRVSNITSNQEFGFCRLCISHELMNVTDITVMIDDGQTPVLYSNYDVYDNTTHRWIYFAYPHSVHEIDVLAEFPSFITQTLFLIATLIAVTAYKRETTEEAKYIH